MRLNTKHDIEKGSNPYQAQQMNGKYELLTIKDLIFSGNQNPDHPAIESPGYRPLTYRGPKIQVIQVIKTLNALGFGRNDRIAVIMPARS